jgi:hypothetical protein
MGIEATRATRASRYRQVEIGAFGPINVTSSAVSSQSKCLLLALPAEDVVVSVAYISSSVNALCNVLIDFASRRA